MTFRITMERVIVRHIKSIGVLLLSFSTALSGLTLAAPTPAAPTVPNKSTQAVSAVEIQTIRNNAVRAVTQMFMYIALEKARERKQVADKAIADVDAALPQLNDPTLIVNWQKARTALATKPFHDSGDINQLILYHWENETMPFLGELDQHMPRNISRVQKDLYDLVTRMQLMTIIYLRNNADPLGGNNYIGANSDKDLGTLSKEFTRHLNDLIRSNPTLKTPLAKVSAKWAFLSQHIADHRVRNVPYIVDLYGHQVIDLLLAEAHRR
jgi:hypothetical protein